MADMEDLPFPFAVSPVPPGTPSEVDLLRAQLAAALKERCVHGTVPSERDLLNVQSERDALGAEVERLTKERDREQQRGDWLDGAYDNEVKRRYDEARGKIEYWHKEADWLGAENARLRAAIEPTEATLDAVVDVLDDAHFDKREKAERVLAAIAARAKGTP